MKINYLILIACLYSTLSIAQRIAPDTIDTREGNVIIQPIKHATFVLQWNDRTIYVDPTGGADAFKGIKAPDLILITDIHGDHTNLETLRALDTKNAKIIVPPAVADLLRKDFEKQLVVIRNNGMTAQGDIFIIAMPMYNLPNTADSRHPKGRGNGYLINMAGKNIYVSGDTEDIIEMRDLHRVDIAFICMNLPYTMDIKQAASAVLEFKPKIVYPYHYRGKPEMSDIKAFKKLVNDKNPFIEVRLRNWYPK